MAVLVLTLNLKWNGLNFLGLHKRHRQREKQAPCREPDVGLDPRSPGSGPGLKVALNR